MACRCAAAGAGLRLALLLALLLAAVTPSALAAQRVGVEIVLPDRNALATEPPAVRTSGVLTSTRAAELVRNGFPARLHYELERWSAGTLVNDLRARMTWDVIAEYDVLARAYRLVRISADTAVLLGAYATAREADAALAVPLPVPIRLPRRGERSYYRLRLEVTALSFSDLDELRRWLRGGLRPAVRGRVNPGSAIGAGLRTLFVRVLGGERVDYEASTGVFRP